MEEKIFYDSTDNIKLCGLLSKVNDSDKITILCHGIRGNKNERVSFIPLTEELQRNNINSFRFDFRAHGESSGIDYEMTVTKEVQDLERTIDMLKSKGFKEFILLGPSFGASIISLLDYSKYNCVKSLICWYGAIDYLATIEEESFFAQDKKKIAEEKGYFTTVSKSSGRTFRFGKDLYDEVYSLKPYEDLIKLEKPILFVHGIIDDMVPYQLSEKISKMCKDSRLELIPNGNHTFDNDKEALKEAINKTAIFIREMWEEKNG